MDLEIENRRMFEAFGSLNYSLEASKVSMWSLTDRYSYPPFFRFKFKGLAKQDPFYARIKDAVEKYVGNVEWTIYNTEEIANYILVPKLFSRYLGSGVPFQKSFLLTIFKEDEYMRLIDLSIYDVKSLSQVISKCR